MIKQKIKHIVKKNRINKNKDKFFNMSTYNLNYREKFQKLFLTQIFAVLWSIWSFKLLQNLSIIKTTKKRKKQKRKDRIDTKFSNNIFLKHTENKRSYLNYIIKSSVCPLGTFGSIMIIFWASLQLYIIKALSKNNIMSMVKSRIMNMNKQTITKGLSVATFSIMLIYFYLSYIMNYPLFVRTIPWFVSQGYISYQLYNYVK